MFPECPRPWGIFRGHASPDPSSRSRADGDGLLVLGLREQGRFLRNPFCFFRIGRISFFRLSRIHLSFHFRCAFLRIRANMGESPFHAVRVIGEAPGCTRLVCGAFWELTSDRLRLCTSSENLAVIYGPPSCESVPIWVCAQPSSTHSRPRALRPSRILC